MVTSVTADIIKVAVEEGLLTNLSPKIFVIDEKAANAFVLPSGDIFVFAGILPFAKDKDGLAAVLAHEVKKCTLKFKRLHTKLRDILLKKFLSIIFSTLH
jgi:predicted Zn-dependent protease